MEKPEVKTIIEVGGIYLTVDAINELKSLQNNKNDGIREIRESIIDTIGFIAGMSKTMEGDELKKVKLLMRNLALIDDSIKKLKKP